LRQQKGYQKNVTVGRKCHHKSEIVKQNKREFKSGRVHVRGMRVYSETWTPKELEGAGLAQQCCRISKTEPNPSWRVLDP
jgi:hypothetical protein